MEKRTVVDLMTEMRNHNDIGLANQVQHAIDECVRQGIIQINDELDGDSLGEIRAMIYEINRNPNAINLAFDIVTGKTKNPVEAAITFIEKKAATLYQ